MKAIYTKGKYQFELRDIALRRLERNEVLQKMRFFWIVLICLFRKLLLKF